MRMGGLVIMAYATAEQRKQKAADHEGSFSVENYLQNCLRNEYSYESLQSSMACEAAEKRLAQQAKTYDLKVGIKNDPAYYQQLAQDAIVHFLNNKEEGNQQGSHEGHNLGNSTTAETQRNILPALSDVIM